MIIHVNGIGGKGMAPVAGLAHLNGHIVTGDDISRNHRVEILEKLGMDIAIGRNFPGYANTEIVVSSSALTAKNVDDSRLIMSRLEFVDWLFRNAGKKQITIAGSFGKSTASSIMHKTLSTINPSCYIGAELNGTICGASLCHGEYAVVEACEYQNNYFALHPHISILLNVFQNHEDCFGEGVTGFQKSFIEFTRKNRDCLEYLVIPEELLEGLCNVISPTVRLVSVGFGDSCHWKIVPKVINRDVSVFCLMNKERKTVTDDFAIRICGKSMMVVAAMSLVVGLECLRMDPEGLKRNLLECDLPLRRLSIQYQDNVVTCIDDNARHATQVNFLIEMLRQKWPDAYVCLVTSPWGKKNARNLIEWANALSGSNYVVILPVGDCAVSRGGAEDDNAAEMLSSLLRRNDVECNVVNSINEAADIIARKFSSKKHTVVVTAGYDLFQEQFVELHMILKEQALRSV